MAAGWLGANPYRQVRPTGRRRHPATAEKDQEMHLTPREFDKLTILSLAMVANARRAKGLKLNHPESVAVICAAALEGAREGKTVEEVMNDARTVLKADDVMPGVGDMIPMLQVEAVFTDGSRLITIHSPIQ
ncbi:urease subunit gamma [Micromonospora gifhornensis]|uniref:urease subunit gamma n=1 Tax=Micromonospora gifhornensis TaxID=84594 RepID=UPI003F509E05